MKRRLRARLWLAAIVASLLLAVVVQHRHAQQQTDATRLLPFSAHAVTRIAIQLNSRPTQYFLHRDGHWWTQHSPPQRADDARLEALAAIADAQVVRWLPKGRNLDKFGLHPPFASLQLNGVRLGFGHLAVLSPERYLLLPNGRIAMVADRYTPYLGVNTATPAPSSSTAVTTPH